MNTNAQPKTNPRDSVLARFMLGFPGHSLPGELREYLAQGLAGVVIYKRNFASVEHLLDLTAAIREAAGRPVLIGIDQEGGTRFAFESPFTRWPSATELGQLGDAEAAEKIAHAMALEIRAAGCNLDFAPMLDLHVNPESPVTQDRSFGTDPDLVARMGAAFDRGLRRGGVLSCAKHFPGHGDAAIDPHLELPIFAGTMARLESTELVPFAAAVASGTELIMTAHILLPQIDADNPASLSRLMLDQVLRRGMKFNGIILADDLGMGAIAKRYGPGDAAIKAIHSGTDIAMLCHDWTEVAPAIDSVRNAYKEGQLDEIDWQASLKRIERICNLAETVRERPSIEVIGSEENQRLSERVRSRLQ
ncbi:MAG TPA: beta-N-acetylhexosaminidase [Candidatus Saccharimonadales bacterium]|jgi:beta-N-acetylhexosaminidase|nr:beta-N-acetylhexosaminidase [Candidatus Saccharimonadales bacterium]